MKKITFLSIYFYFGFLLSCGSGNHFHDGKYHADIDVFGVSFAKIDYLIEGDEITIENSVSGTSKLKCRQYPDRIEYIEPNGTTKVLYVLENGNIQVNDHISLVKVN